jgi:hypothetical protein
MRQCITCQNPINIPYPECYLCHNMRRGMPIEDFHQQMRRITVYNLEKSNGGRVAVIRANLYPRPVSAPLCTGKCIATPNWTQVKNRQKKLGGNMNEKYYTNITSLPCHYCAIFPCGGVDRIDSLYGYYRQNTLPCCWLCNQMKGSNHADIFTRHAHEVAFSSVS